MSEPMPEPMTEAEYKTAHLVTLIEDDHPGLALNPSLVLNTADGPIEVPVIILSKPMTEGPHAGMVMQAPLAIVITSVLYPYLSDPTAVSQEVTTLEGKL